jgi:hypothetical protein
MVKSIIIIFFCFFSVTLQLHSQIYSDTARGEVGDEIIININIPDSITAIGINSISGKFFITNPTVFYPDSLTSGNNININNKELVRQNDSIWNFNIELQKPLDSISEVIVKLFGEALAGTDSICILKFTGVKLNDTLIHDFDAVIYTHTSGTPLPYIRFAKLDQNFPNPVQGGSSTKWHYIIDKPSIVEFYIVDYRGKETFLTNLGEQAKGIHEYIFTPEMGFSSGLYWMKLRTNTGESLVPFIIAK